MSYENVVGGKLKIKGKALDVKAGGIKKKKKKERKPYEQLSVIKDDEISSVAAEDISENISETAADGGRTGGEAVRPALEDHRTPAEKKYHEQKLKLEACRFAKASSKSHRERIEDFNQYLANLSEHYDIPKVGPG